MSTPPPLGHGFLIFSVDWDGTIQFLQTNIKTEIYAWDEDLVVNVKSTKFLYDVHTSTSSRLLEDYTNELWQQQRIDYGGVYRLDGYVLPSGVGGRLTTLLEPNPARLAPPVPVEEFLDGVLEKTQLPNGDYQYSWLRNGLPTVEPRGGRPQVKYIHTPR